MRRWIGTGLIALLIAGSFVVVSSTAGEAAWSANRPVQLICPWAAGGGTDRVARMVGILLEKELGQPVTVVNRTGGGGAVGHTAGATAAPDGHTLTIVTVELAMMHWMGLTPLTYKEFTPVTLVNIDAAGVQVAQDAPWKNLKELLDYVKANPGKAKASGTAKGGIWDLARAGLLKTAGIPVDAMPWVPSTGAATGLQELVAGGVTLLQYRNKCGNAREMLAQAQELRTKLGSSVQLVMNDRADLCVAAGLVQGSNNKWDA